MPTLTEEKNDLDASLAWKNCRNHTMFKISSFAVQHWCSNFPPFPFLVSFSPLFFSFSPLIENLPRLCAALVFKFPPFSLPRPIFFFFTPFLFFFPPHREEPSPAYSLLSSCIPPHSALKQEVIVGVCASILAKARRPAACLTQHIISCILYAGHCSKQVSTHSNSYDFLFT